MSLFSLGENSRKDRHARICINCGDTFEVVKLSRSWRCSACKIKWRRKQQAAWELKQKLMSQKRKYSIERLDFK